MSMDDNKKSQNDRRKFDSNDIDSELIGIVYEMAFDPCFWPDLLESVGSLFTDRRSDIQTSNVSPEEDLQQIHLFSDDINSTEAQRIAILLPHLYKALQLKRDYNKTDHTRGQAQAIIEHFPFGVLLVNENGKLVSANQHALDTISANTSVYFKDEVFCAENKEQDIQLKNFIYNAANAPVNETDKHVSFLKIEDNKNLSISVLITPDPYPSSDYDKKVERCTTIFITSNTVGQKISKSALQTLFNFSPAETRLAILLASGITLNHAAEQSNISKNTARVQLKSIFYKTGVRRQAELVKLILTSPAVIDSTSDTNEDTLSKTKTKLKEKINKEEHIILKDGRKLHYAEYGEPLGIPIILLHGALGSRYERFPDDILTKNLGVRLIIPDRPGYGHSEHAVDHGYLEFADDLIELIDHLELQKISIMGISVGAIYGSAFAYKTPQRLQKLGMVSSTPPFRSFSDFTGVPPSFKLLIAFSKYLPTAAKIITEIAITNACNNPEKFLANIPASKSDQALFNNPLLKEHIETCLLAGSKDSHFGFIQDILQSAKSWPFPVEDIQITIDFWHGADDLHSPFSRIKPVIDAVPNKNLHLIHDGGHFLFYDHWQEILQSLTFKM